MSTVVIVIAWSIVAYVVSSGAIGCYLSFRHRSSSLDLSPHVGDCTDEMFEAMREVDALTPSVPPMLTPLPKPGEPVNKPQTYEEAMREFRATYGVHSY